MKTIMLASVLILLAGCSSVLIKEPFPDSELTTKECSAFTGTWLYEKQVMDVAFTSNGIPYLATMDWKDDQFVINKYRVHATKKGDTLYVSLPVKPNGESADYFFAEIQFEGDRIYLWPPSAGFFEEQIKQGSLKGSVDTKGQTREIVLETPASEILDLIATNSAALDYKHPLILKKLN